MQKQRTGVTLIWKYSLGNFVNWAKVSSRNPKWFWGRFGGWTLHALWVKKICDALRDLVSLVQLKNVKNTQGGVLLLVKLQPANLLKLIVLHGCLSSFSNFTNGTRSCKASYIDHCSIFLGYNGRAVNKTLAHERKSLKVVGCYNQAAPKPTSYYFKLYRRLPKTFKTITKRIKCLHLACDTRTIDLNNS